MTRDEILLNTLARLAFVVAGKGPEIRPVADMRAINIWIEQAVDASLLDRNGFEASMLQALEEGTFEILAIGDDGEPRFSLTDYGRARVDSMPHNSERLTPHGVSGE